MRAFHSCWSEPYIARGIPFAPPAFDLLTTALSALVWARENGDIYFYADGPARAFYQPFSYLWKEIRPLVLPDWMDGEHFWAMGKLCALREMGAPCVMLDTDFIVWENLDWLVDYPLATIHREAIDADVYPDPRTLHQDGSFSWDGLPMDALPANTAVAWFRDADFLQKYLDTALRFCKAARPDNPLTYMVCAEQRVLAMVAEKEGVSLGSLTDGDELSSGQQRFSHVWGYKQILREDAPAAHEYCLRCARRLQADFPEQAKKLAQHPLVRGYFAG